MSKLFELIQEKILIEKMTLMETIEYIFDVKDEVLSVCEQQKQPI